MRDDNASIAKSAFPQRYNPHARQTGEALQPAARPKDSCCLASFLNRLHKFQQVGVDFVLVRGR